MPARAYWKGYLRLSLVTIAIELYSAVSSTGKLSLHQIHKPSGKRIRYQKVAPGIGPVDTDDIVKGFEVDKDEYVLLEPDELDAIKLESKRTIDLVQFVDFCEIDPRYFEKPYYVLPAEDEVAAEGFAVIRDALDTAKKVALGQLAARGRDYVVAIRPCGDGLLLETLRYADEIRRADRIFSAIPDSDPDAEMLELAGELIKRKSAPFDSDAFHSQYSNALRELIDEKRETGHVTEASDDELSGRGGRGGEVVDLMEALKKSVAKSKKRGKTNRKRKTSGKKAAAGG